MQGRDPRRELVRDKRCLVCVRGANLDAFWVREPSTVASNLSCVQRDYAEAREALGLTELYPLIGPFPLQDEVGMAAACMTGPHSGSESMLATCSGIQCKGPLRLGPTCTERAPEAWEGR